MYETHEYCAYASFVLCRYVAPEYAGTGMLNETSDVYSFGILIMEIISGRVPVDYNRPPGEVSDHILPMLVYDLVNWIYQIYRSNFSG